MTKSWRRGTSQNLAVTKNNSIVEGLWRDHNQLGTWQAVGAKFGLTPALVYRVAHGYEPKKPAIRAALGLPALAPAPVCPRHGVVHTRACRAARAPRRLFDWPTKALARAIRERA